METPNEFFKRLCSEWAELAPPDWTPKVSTWGAIVLTGIPADALKEFEILGAMTLGVSSRAAFIQREFERLELAGMEDEKIEGFYLFHHFDFDLENESIFNESSDCFQQFISDPKIMDTVRKHRSKWDKEALTKRVGVSTLNETGDAL